MPQEFKFVKVEVDGAHWEGVKKLRQPDSTDRIGHLGCSEGIFNLLIVFHKLNLKMSSFTL